MITLNNISKTYKNSNNEIALNNISTTFKEGYVHGIIGVSGAGKSTLIRLINLLETYDTGTLSVFNYTNVRELNKESTRMLRKDIGMIFQQDNLLSRKTVMDNVLFPITFHRPITLEDKKYASQLLLEVGLHGYEERYPNELSGGQRQRVGIARAFINNPKLLLCDEPTSALDVITTSTILSLIKTVADNHNVTVIIVTHDMNVIKEICDTVTVMDKGHIVEQGLVDDILFQSKHNQTKAFIKQIGLDLTPITSLYSSNELLLLRFNQNNIHDAVLSSLIKDLKITVSIVYANIILPSTGVMVIHVAKEHQQVKDYLTNKGVIVNNVI